MIATLAAGLAHAERHTDAPASPAPARVPTRNAPVEDRLRALQREFQSYCLPIDDPLPPDRTPT